MLDSENLLAGRFALEQEAGAGGMGVVFRARDRFDGALVAVKRLHHGSTMGERFDREAAILAELRHPGIVRYVAHGLTQTGERYLVMEWLEGEDLSHRLARGALTPQESLTILRKTASALASAHARGVVHRDIKPSNIFLVEGDCEQVKLLDFGIAKIAEGGPQLTRPGMMIGTPSYMAPEQAQCLAAVDSRTDVFALGCVLFKCLTGRPVFEGAHAMTVLAKIILQPAPALREIQKNAPEPVERLLERMLAKAPADRLRDAAAVLEALDALGDLEGTWSAPPDLSSGARPPTLEPSSPPSSLTHREQRLVSVVLAAAPPAEGAAATRERVELSLAPYGGRLDVLADGSMLVTVWGTGSAADRAERAARCALTLRASFAGVPLHVVTGRGVVSAKVVEGEVIDRGVRALREVEAGVIQLDPATADLIGARFLVDPAGGALALRGERSHRERASLLLGKPIPCLGRSRELSLLETLFASCADDSMAGAALVTGPAGSGKSRLIRELLERLQRGGVPVEILTAQGDSLGEGSPFGMIADAIRNAAGIRVGEPLEVRRQKLLLRLGRSLAGPALARVAAFLGELVRAPSADDGAPALRAAHDNPMLMGDAMRAAWEEWIAAECERAPLLLVLDDLQWGDASTVQLLDATLRNLHDRPLLVLVLARPEVHKRFPGLWAKRAVQSVQLGPLGRKASEQLVLEALGHDADAGATARIVERAGGNPFYLEELIRAVAAGRGDSFPDSVLGTVEARLDAEGSEAKRILRAASVFGDRFSARGVASLLGEDDRAREAGGWLEVLAARELIGLASTTGLPGDTSYVFRHALVREAAYAMLTEGDRVLGHRLAGAWLERIGHPDAMALAEHFIRGGAPADAARHYRRGAEEALEANDLVAVLERAERAVACGLAGEDLGALRLVEAEAHVWRGESALAEQRGVEAVERLASGSSGWFRAVALTGIAAGKLGGFDRIEGWVRAARAAVLAPDARNAQVLCLSTCATNLILGGRYAAADVLLETLEPVEDLDAEALGVVAEARSIRASTRGDLGECLAGLRAAHAAFEQAGDHRNVCTTRSNLGYVYAELGDFEGAEEALRGALAMADRLGLHDPAAMALQNLGQVLAYCGRPAEGRTLELQALEMFQRQTNPRMASLARISLAKIELLAGDLVAAEREARAAAAVLAAAPQLRAAACALLGRALLGRGCVAEARAVAGEAFALLESLGTIEEGEALVRLVHAEACAASGDESAFAVAIASARFHLLERASKISDPAWRERFLRGVPDNARTLALGLPLGP